ncbi:MAG: sigma factor-like helix-turn-helix DNA-binding protein [Terracidiphilus sp.]|nr:sigma factor-like helix-turn-helix DNA-binding protein [Terracidiphilus sp.]
MSAALQLPVVWGVAEPLQEWKPGKGRQTEQRGVQPRQKQEEQQASEPLVSVGFYRKHTESMLRRYLYASMQVGRTPSILSDPVGRGWVSSRPVRTFEDAVIFVLDVERCLAKLNALDRMLLSRITLQEYTQAEAATLIGMSTRTVAYKYPQALDRLTELLLEADLLILDRG